MRWLPTLLWMGLIFLLSSIPDATISQTGWLDFIIRKTIHLFEYGVLAILLAQSLKDSPRVDNLLHGARPNGQALYKKYLPNRYHDRYMFWESRIKPFILAVVYAAADEFHQSFVPGRTGIWTDVLVDGLGATLGLWLWSWLEGKIPWSGRR